jgi:hypothetical protein
MSSPLLSAPSLECQQQIDLATCLWLTEAYIPENDDLVHPWPKLHITKACSTLRCLRLLPHQSKFKTIAGWYDVLRASMMGILKRRMDLIHVLRLPLAIQIKVSRYLAYSATSSSRNLSKIETRSLMFCASRSRLFQNHDMEGFMSSFSSRLQTHRCLTQPSFTWIYPLLKIRVLQKSRVGRGDVAHVWTPKREPRTLYVRLRERNSKGICHSGMSALGRACTYQQIDFTAQEGPCFLKRKKKGWEKDHVAHFGAENSRLLRLCLLGASCRRPDSATMHIKALR